jgi:hypothetical protein
MGPYFGRFNFGSVGIAGNGICRVDNAMEDTLPGSRTRNMFEGVRREAVGGMEAESEAETEAGRQSICIGIGIDAQCSQNVPGRGMRNVQSEM